MSAANVRFFVAFGVSLTLVPTAFAAPQEAAVRDLLRIENGLRVGTVITAVSRALPSGSTAIERCTLFEDSIRVDAIMGYRPGKPLRNPTVVVHIATPSSQVSASIGLSGDFKSADDAFHRLYSKPAPEVRKVEGDQPMVARSLQVLGYTGSEWLSAKLQHATDTTMTREGDGEVITWGKSLPLKTQVRLRDKQAFLAGYEYFPGPSNKAFKRFAIRQLPAATGALATFEKVTVGSEADEHYELSIIKMEHAKPPTDFFTLDESDHSLVNSVEDPESVSRIVNGKRVLHYSGPNPNSEGRRLWAILGVVTGAILLIVCSVGLFRRLVKAKH